MNLVHLILLLAVGQYFAFGVLVGRARVRYGVKAPAVTGHEGFERMYRVQMNTLEQLAGFLPCLAVAGQYWPPALVAGIGLVYLVGRTVYWRAYVADPPKRQIGFLLTVIPTCTLFALAVVGALIHH